MRYIDHIEFETNSQQEKLPGYTPDFPYIASRVQFDSCAGQSSVPWHWHQPVELFYVSCGALIYETPQGMLYFPAGTGGLVNSNVLHMTRIQPGQRQTVQLLHIFDGAFLVDAPGGHLAQTYLMPMLAAPQLEVLPLYPDQPAHAAALQLLQQSFLCDDQQFGYALRLRGMLAEIWLELMQIAAPILEQTGQVDPRSARLKQMLLYIHTHYGDKLTVAEVAAAAFLSERECFRLFRDCLRMPPQEYIRRYRLQAACRMLAREQTSVTTIGHVCGLGSSSYFGQVFRAAMGCTPIEYRRRWRDSDMK